MAYWWISLCLACDRIPTFDDGLANSVPKIYSPQSGEGLKAFNI